MDISKIGTNIRLLREEKGITREQFCEEEKELSARQLMRIEKGQSTPTLEKLAYIAEKLDVTVIKLLDLSATSDGVPQKYWNLKQEIENYSSFDAEEKELRVTILMEMYDHYYDSLPKEEQLFVDCMMTLNDIYEALNTSFLTIIINKYKYVLEYDFFEGNDLVFISIYLILKSETKMWNDETDMLVAKINPNTIRKSRFAYEFLVRIYINVVSHYLAQKKYEDAIVLLNTSVQLICTVKIYNRLPIIYMLLAKSYLGLGKKTNGDKYYQKAIKLAELLNLEALKKKIRVERDKDVL